MNSKHKCNVYENHMNGGYRGEVDDFYPFVPDDTLESADEFYPFRPDEAPRPVDDCYRCSHEEIDYNDRDKDKYPCKDYDKCKCKDYDKHDYMKDYYKYLAHCYMAQAYHCKCMKYLHKKYKKKSR